MIPQAALDISKEETGQEYRLRGNRYRVLSEIGRGCWGVVSKAHDTLTGETVALKEHSPTELASEQMVRRNLDELAVMVREAGKFTACSNVVPRWFEQDGQGPFIVMPIYRRNLEEVITQGSTDLHLDSGLTAKQVMSFTADIANSIMEAHERYSRAHGDIKPNNYMVSDDGRVHLTDLGTSTIISTTPSLHNGDQHGFIYTRAPESFRTDSKPTKRGDIWSFGSLFYRFITGRYVLGDFPDPQRFIESKSSEEFDRHVSRKVDKNIPKAWRPFLKKCLRWSPLDRFSDGQELYSEFKAARDKSDYLTRFKKSFWNWTLKLSIPAASLASVFLLNSIYTPPEANIPVRDYKATASYVNGIPFDSDPVFVREDLELPETDYDVTIDRSRAFKRFTRSRIVVALANKYFTAVDQLGGPRRVYTTEGQSRIYGSYVGPDEKQFMSQPNMFAVIRSIEVGISKSRNIDGNYDLEDTCTIGRVGLELWEEAKRYANNGQGSFEFREYIRSKRADGSYVIPEKEQRFIRTWLSHIR